MISTSRRVFAAMAVSVMALVAAGPVAAEPFRIITTDLEPQLVPNSVMDLALSLGYFEREGVDVQLVRVQQTPLAAAALQAGEGEMANIGVDAALQMVGRNVLSMKAVISPNKSLPFLIAGKDSVKSLADLQGKAFGVGRIGSVDHSLSTAVMRANGVNPDSVNFLAIGQPNVRGQALSAGQIDATTMSIGVWLSLPVKSGLHVIVDPDAYFAAAPVINKVNVVPDAVLAKRGDDVAAVVRAIINASRDFSRDPSIWVDAMAKERPDVSRETLEFLGNNFVGAWSVNGGLNREELATTQEFFYAGPDFVDLRKVELSEWVDLSFIAKHLDAAGTAENYDAPAF